MERSDVLVATRTGLVSGHGAPVAAAERSVDALATSAAGAWIVVDGRHVIDVAEPGETFATLPHTEVALTALHGGDDGLLVGSEPPRLFVLRPGDVVEPIEDFDRVRGRQRWSTPWGGPPAVRSIASAPDGTLYVNVHVGGVVRHDERGWQPTIDVAADVHEVAVDDDGAVFAATARGLAVSTDRGETWNFATDGLHDTYCRAVAILDEQVLVSASTGPHTTHGALYRAARSAPVFARVGGGLPARFEGNIDSGCVAVQGEQVAVGGPEGAVYVSEDTGGSWERTTSGLATIHAVAWAG